MWLYLVIFAAIVFAVAGIFSPLAWFLFPAVALFALAIAAMLGVVGGGRESKEQAADPSSGPQSAPAQQQQAGDADAVTGYAHQGQARTGADL